MGHRHGVAREQTKKIATYNMSLENFCIRDVNIVGRARRRTNGGSTQSFGSEANLAIGTEDGELLIAPQKDHKLRAAGRNAGARQGLLLPQAIGLRG